GAGVKVAATDADRPPTSIRGTSDVDPRYTTHFGPTPPILTDATRTSTLERIYTITHTTYGALGTFSSSTPTTSTLNNSRRTSSRNPSPSAPPNPPVLLPHLPRRYWEYKGRVQRASNWEYWVARDVDEVYGHTRIGKRARSSRRARGALRS
ncbi:hypothetical protein PENSPDRAFT_602723, partial [Peniophora sp. CONT]